MTVLLAGTRADALRVRVAGSDVQSLALVGTIRGVTPLAVAGLCGEGTAKLRSTGAPPRRFQFRAPGSSTWGEEVTVAATGEYLLEDGADRSKWIRVRVDLAWLPDGPAEANVFLRDRWNELGPDDVTAAEAAAGSVDPLTLDLVNVSPNRLDGLRAWLVSGTVDLELSPDGSAWSAPTTEGAGISLGALAPSASVPLYVRRTITAGAPPATKVLNRLRLSWEGA